VCIDLLLVKSLLIFRAESKAIAWFMPSSHITSLGLVGDSNHPIAVSWLHCLVTSLANLLFTR
jgi:hypothetical protein